MRKNNNKLSISMLLVALLSSMAYLPVLSNAAIVWSDNFNDGDYDDWTIANGEFSASNGYLECTYVESLTNPSWIYCNSTVSSGTWSFDCYVEEGYLSIDLMKYENSWQGPIRIYLDTAAIGMYTRDDEFHWNPEKDIGGTWTSINVTVDENWIFNVFVNGTHRLNHEMTMPYGDRDWQWFAVWSWDSGGQIIDNIVVQNTIDYEGLNCPTEYIPTTETTETETTTTTEPTTSTSSTGTTEGAFPIELLAIGAIVVVVIVIVAFKVKRS